DPGVARLGSKINRAGHPAFTASCRARQASHRADMSAGNVDNVIPAVVAPPCQAPPSTPLACRWRAKGGEASGVACILPHPAPPLHVAKTGVFWTGFFGAACPLRHLP